MRPQLLALTALLGATFVAAAGAEQMDKLMGLKEQSWARASEAGVFGGSKKYPKQTSMVPCTNGYAGEYMCDNVDLYGFLSHEDLGSATLRGNDVWGWTSPDGREFGIVGETDGVAFVEINLPKGDLSYLGRLPTYTTNTSWRDIKVIKNHAYIGAESPGHGIQIFDLTKLLDVNPATPYQFDSYRNLTSHFYGVGATHNLVAHEETDMIYAVGGREGANGRTTECAGGLFMIDVSDPSNPVSPGCVGIGGYVHDAQCVIYTGPTEKYQGKEICFGYNEDTLTVYDVTDKANVYVVSNTSYVGNAYTHQGWLIDETMTYLLLDDELDELDQIGPPAGELGGMVNHTTTYLFDVTNLEAPVNTGYYQSPAKSIDHNQYTVAGLSYQANYGSGLRIIDVSGVPVDPTGGNIEQVGFFDCHPEDDAYGEVEFLGTWSVYPYFKSGYILLNSIERGIYSLKYTGRGKAF